MLRSSSKKLPFVLYCILTLERLLMVASSLVCLLVINGSPPWKEIRVIDLGTLVIFLVVCICTRDSASGYSFFDQLEL